MSVRVGGEWLPLYGTVAEVDYSSIWRRDGYSGPHVASWTFGVDADILPAFVRQGQVVELWDGPERVWGGFLAEPAQGTEPGTWQLSAAGWGAAANGYLALTESAGTFTASRDADTVITQAITSRGLAWLKIDTVGAVPGSVNGNADSLTELLNEAAAYLDRVWHLNDDAQFTIQSDPTTPTWLLSPQVPVPGRADEQYVSHLFGYYVHAETGTPPQASEWRIVLPAGAQDATAAAFWRRKEQLLDLTPLGLLPATTASTWTAAKFRRIGARMGWAEPVQGDAYTLSHVDGAPARLSQIRAGQMLRMYGATNDGPTPETPAAVDVVLGEVRYRLGEDVIYLAPTGLADRDFTTPVGQPKPWLSGRPINF